MTSGNNRKFQYGKKIYDIFHYAKLGILLKGSIELASMIPGLNKKQVFNAVDVLQQKFGIDILNDYIIKDEEFLTYRIERTVSQSIKNYDETT